MFYWSFTSLVHFWPPPIFNPDYAHAVTAVSAATFALHDTLSLTWQRLQCGDPPLGFGASRIQTHNGFVTTIVTVELHDVVLAFIWLEKVR